MTIYYEVSDFGLAKPEAQKQRCNDNVACLVVVGIHEGNVHRVVSFLYRLYWEPVSGQRVQGFAQMKDSNTELIISLLGIIGYNVIDIASRTCYNNQ